MNVSFNSIPAMQKNATITKSQNSKSDLKLNTLANDKFERSNVSFQGGWGETIARGAQHIAAGAGAAGSLAVKCSVAHDIGARTTDFTSGLLSNSQWLWQQGTHVPTLFMMGVSAIAAGTLVRVAREKVGLG